MSKKNIITTAIIVILFVTAAGWYISENLGNVDGDPWDMIPQDAALIVEIDNPGDVFNKVVVGNSIWQSLLSIDNVKKLDANISLLDTLLVENTEYSNLLHNSPLIIALYADSINTVETLILSKINSNIDINRVKSYLSSELNRGYGLLEIAGVSDGFKLVSAEDNRTSYFAFLNGVFVYTSSSELLYDLMGTFKGKLPRLTQDPTFIKLKQTGGAKVQARAFFQYNQISEIINPLVNSDKKKELALINNFASWTEVDILIKDEELIFSGFSISENDNSYLNKLEGQQPVKLEATSVIPYNSNTVVWLGLSNFKKYFNNSNTDSKIKSISAKLNYDVSNLVDVIGDEIVFASNAESTASYSGSSWFIVKTLSNKNAVEVLKRIALNTGSPQTTKHNSYEIRKINKSNFVPEIFGSIFSAIENNYYTFIGDYAVFANSESSLINLISYFETGKTLDLNDNFKAFSDNISSQSNLLMYIRPGDLLNRLIDYSNQDVVKHFKFKEKVVGSFQGLAFQYSHGDPLSFSNFYIKHSEVIHEENLALWKVQLDDEIVRGPFLVLDHQTKKQSIIVFDKPGSIYLINSDGKVLWKKKVDGLPLSDIYQIDYFKNGKIQYLFNTSDYIYLIDKIGRNVTGYPKKLHSKATNGIVVLDYLKNRDYRLLIAQADKRIHNYSKSGKEIKGWNQPRTQNIVIEPVTRLVANKKDYIIISDIENEIKIVDRKGKRRIKLSSKLKKAKNSDFYVNRTNSKGIVITTDERGRLVYISSSGKLNYTDFGNFSPGHFFLYEDFNGDGSKDFIFIDDKKLVVFDRFKTELFSYQFGSEITIKPKFFTFGRKQHVLGVVANTERTIYLFDNKGNIIISKGLVGETPFTVGNLDNDNKINLVSAAGSMLYNYRLK